MLRTAVVEDEPQCRKQILDMIEKYASENHKQIESVEFADGQELLDAGANSGFDLLLLDIEMPNMNGMKAAEKIRMYDKEAVIVFITNIARYALKGYEVDALDFIIKPIDYSTFRMRFARAVRRAEERERRKVGLELADRIKWMDSRQIYYVETRSRLLYYHTAEGVFSVRAALKDVQKKLEPYHFIKCNQCYLVNLYHVSEIRKGIAVVAGEELEISRRSQNAFLAAVADYMGSC